MRIDKHLNLVLPVWLSETSAIYVHSTPISADVFDTYFLPIAKTFSAIYGEGLGAIAGPRVADKLLKRISVNMEIWDTKDGGVKSGLVGEIHRLTNVLAPGPRGWEMVPFDDAVARGTIDPQDAAEIEAALVFFTVASSMHRRTDAGAILDGAMRLWGARTESLSCTEFMRSLPTSTSSDSSGATAMA